MANLATLVVNLTANTSNYQKGMSGAAKITKSTTDKIQKIGKVAMGAALGGIAALGTGIFLVARKAIPAASDLVESQNAVDKVFGKSSKTILAWGKNAAKQAGLAESEFFQMSAQTGAMLQNLGIEQKLAADESINLAQRAADMASIFNTDVADALGAIQAGLRGEADPLERYGVRLSQAAVKAKALELGLLDSTGAMDDQARATASLALLYEQTDAMAGDFVETSGDFANAQRVARAQLENFMAKLGKMFLPILGKVFGYISQTVMPILNTFANYITLIVEEGDVFNKFLAELPEWLQPIVKIMGNVIVAFQNFFGYLRDGADLLSSVFRLFYDLALAFGMSEEEATKLSWKLYGIYEGFLEVKNAVMEFMAPIFEWIANTVTWKDVLIALGIAILTVVIPAVISLLATLLPIILIGAALVLAVALIRKAWEEDWGGIRTKLTQVWNDIKPKLDELKEWLEVKLPIAIENLKNKWVNDLEPDLRAFWDWMETKVFPLFEIWWAWLEEDIPSSIQTSTDFWNNVLYPAIEDIWKFLSEDMMPIWIALVEILDAGVSVSLEALAGLWENTLQPALQDLWEWIKDKILPIFSDFSESGEGLAGIIERVAKFINDAADAIRNLPNKLPAWITGQSPSPFELSLIGSANALSMLNDQMGIFDRQMNFRTPALVTASAPGAGGGSGAPVIVYGGLHLHGVEDGESLLESLSELMP